MFLGKVFISVCAGWFAYAVLDNAKTFQAGQPNQLSSTWVVILVTMFFAYFVASAFFSILDLSVDTILVCYVTDIEETAARFGGAKVASHVDVDKQMAKAGAGAFDGAAGASAGIEVKSSKKRGASSTTPAVTSTTSPINPSGGGAGVVPGSAASYAY